MLQQHGLRHPQQALLGLVMVGDHAAKIIAGAAGHLRQHIVKPPGHLFAPGIRDYAKRAVFAATFHDRDERARAFHVTDADLVELGVFLAPATVHEFKTSHDGRAAA